MNRIAEPKWQTVWIIARSWICVADAATSLHADELLPRIIRAKVRRSRGYLYVDLSTLPVSPTEHGINPKTGNVDAAWLHWTHAEALADLRRRFARGVERLERAAVLCRERLAVLDITQAPDSPEDG